MEPIRKCRKSLLQCVEPEFVFMALDTLVDRLEIRPELIEEYYVQAAWANCYRVIPILANLGIKFKSTSEEKFRHPLYIAIHLDDQKTAEALVKHGVTHEHFVNWIFSINKISLFEGFGMSHEVMKYAISSGAVDLDEEISVEVGGKIMSRPARPIVWARVYEDDDAKRLIQSGGSSDLTIQEEILVQELQQELKDAGLMYESTDDDFEFDEE
jgi:hypothetical protein